MNIAKEIKIGIALTLLFILVVVIGILNSNIQTKTKTTSKTTTTNTSRIEQSVYSVNEVAKHNSVSDCWLIINNKVYNVTSYLDSHPGGIQVITQYCGADATAAYTGMLKHGTRANSDLATLIIGNIK